MTHGSNFNSIRQESEAAKQFEGTFGDVILEFVVIDWIMQQENPRERFEQILDVWEQKVKDNIEAIANASREQSPGAFDLNARAVLGRALSSARNSLRRKYEGLILNDLEDAQDGAD
jgi:hypothetical protein